MEVQKRILVIDDDPTIVTLLQSVLASQGYEVMTAPDGLAGLEKYKNFGADLIILDILMPKMDGYTFVLEFKKMGGDLRRTPVIVVTSRDSMQDIFEIEGINDYIVKPFKTEDLLRKISKRLQSNEKKILVIDGESEIVKTIQNRLAVSGYEVLIASDGLDALTIAQKEKPDLLVSEIMIPKLDGYRLCRLLKFDRRYKDMPIVFLTNLRRESDKSLGQEVGADAYLSKPYDGKVLLDKIKELLWD
ncbi:MAG: hypothetical protein A2787_09970 [Omnitrophica WOR_2 bacterium RIFCSPHIGHO2_01_FULL_48_9]|nr:MAG: hypothetical protein A3D10_09620 [Omnitrophica WOR_2 bacterium RIFCSPHIGHO2_02_FULL_48_11]OGX31590.1 MAG: hypothetical protein A2787_09970 [Omnitrophica WOR_2 bacterium RIFCSPHIGHO2_01_FULL_48_9]